MKITANTLFTAFLLACNIIEIKTIYKLRHPDLASRRLELYSHLYTRQPPEILYEGNLEYGWYDENNEWIWKTELGFYDEKNIWHWKSGLGSYNKNGEWIWFKDLGYYNDKGEWIWTLYKQVK